MSCLVFVKRSCGQVPQRNDRQTLGSVRERRTVLVEADAPISCSMREC